VFRIALPMDIGGLPPAIGVVVSATDEPAQDRAEEGIRETLDGAPHCSHGLHFGDRPGVVGDAVGEEQPGEEFRAPDRSDLGDAAAEIMPDEDHLA